MGEQTTQEAPREPVLLPDVTVRCAECGYEGPAEPRAPGKLWLEAVCWVAFVVPGMLYSLWRLLRRKHLCPRCKAEGQDVTVRRGYWAFIVLRWVLMVLFFAAVAVLALVWHYPRGP